MSELEEEKRETQIGSILKAGQADYPQLNCDTKITGDFAIAFLCKIQNTTRLFEICSCFVKVKFADNKNSMVFGNIAALS